MGGSPGVIPVIPSENPDTYRWRGDMGLLDRLAYTTNAQEMPRSWEMTNLDAANIALKLQPPEAALPGTAERNLITSSESNLHLGDSPERQKRIVDSREDWTAETNAPPLKKKRCYSSLSLTNGRVRKDKYKRTKGQNPYGRTGVPTCMMCRRWRWKVDHIADQVLNTL